MPPRSKKPNYVESLSYVHLRSKSIKHRCLIIHLVTSYTIINTIALSLVITNENLFAFSTSTNLRDHHFRLSVPRIFLAYLEIPFLPNSIPAHNRLRVPSKGQISSLIIFEMEYLKRGKR